MDKNDIKQLLDAQTKSIDVKLDKQTKSIDAKLDKQTEEITRHQQMLLKEFDSRLKVVTKVVIDHTQKLDALIEMVAMNTESLDFIKSMLKRKVDLDEYEKLERRVSMLEKK